MKISNECFIRWWLNRVSDNKKSDLCQRNECTDRDTFQLSWRAKRDMLNSHIESVENSGEPLTGVSYEDYCNYYYDKHGYRLCDYDMKIEYRQALKGSNASIAEREWRTNPEYRMPPRLYNSPEVISDREAALEKFRSGEQLEGWERTVMSAFPNMREGSKIIEEANVTRTENLLKKKISDAVSEAGLTLSDTDELKFEVWGDELKLSGNISEADLRLIEDKLYGSARGFQTLYHKRVDGFAEKGGFALAFLQSAERYLKEAGGTVSVFDLSIDSGGNIVGLPDEFDSFIKKNAIGEFGSVIDTEWGNHDDIKNARYMKKSFETAVKAIESGDYKRLKAMTCHLTYKNGTLSCN
ncbi:MAG: hypothetical protein ACI4J6_05965 [Oscillospiraceae bacterium]